MNQQLNKKSKGILFLTVFFNLTGFSIILPLSPALLDFYLPTQEQAGGILGHFISASNTLAVSVGHSNSTFMTAVFFGCLLASIYSFLQFLCAPFWGRLSDKFGRRPILLITLAGTALSYALWIFADSFGFFITSRIAAGIMAGNLSVATAAIADVTDKKSRTSGMALIGIAFGLGFVIGPALGGLLTQVNIQPYFPTSWGINPFSTPALVSTLLAIWNFIWVFTRFKETLPESKRDTATSPRMLATLKEQTPNIRKTNLSYFIFLLTFSGLEFTLSFLAVERFNYSPVQIGYLFLYIGFILIFTQGYLIRKLSGRAEERHIASIGFILGISSFNIIALTHSLSGFYIGSTLLSMAIALTTPSLSGLVSLFATEQTQGRFLGLFRSAGSLARAFGPLVAAFPYFYYGASTAYISVSLLLVIPLYVVSTLPSPKKYSPETLDPEEIPST